MANPDSSASDTGLAWAAIGLTLLTCALAVFAWGQQMAWQFGNLTTYAVFPVLGLSAFSVMWSQYVMDAVKNLLGRPTALGCYFNRTGWLVLVLIVLHPGLLMAQRFHDGYGLPPGSYESYVAPMVRWVTLLGTASLLVFLAFETKRFFGDRPWWKYVSVLNDLAVLAIMYHGLRLGQTLGSGWFRGLWFFYGLVLIAVLIYKYARRWQNRRPATVD